MIRPHGLALPVLATALLLALSGPATALETTVSGRVSFGAAFRTEAPDPAMLVSYLGSPSARTTIPSPPVAQMQRPEYGMVLQARNCSLSTEMVVELLILPSAQMVHAWRPPIAMARIASIFCGLKIWSPLPNRA